MKNNLFRLISSIIIVCIIMGTLMPTMVKSVDIVVSGINDTGHGVGETKVFTNKINGYSNIYCVRGGAHLGEGTVLNDNGLSLYNTTGTVVKNSSAIQWLFDNMYLIEEKDNDVKNQMKNNLVKIVKEYNNYKDANGNDALSAKIGVSKSKINDEWINNMVNELLKDTSTLYAVQQYVIWNNVYNNFEAYNNTMRNSDGTYNSIPGAKVDKKYYIALYATLDELSKVAQVNGYKSPNSSGAKFDIKIQKQNSTRVTVSNDLKTAMVGPYKLENNNSNISKNFNVTVDSNKVDKIEIVDRNGKEINVNNSQDQFWIKIKYNKGFEKGVKHNINIDVKLAGHKTYAKLLESYQQSEQPVVALRTEKYNTTTKTDISVEEDLTGRYGLEIEKVNSVDTSKKIQGVSFKVKQDNQEERVFGPTDENGKLIIYRSRAITEEGIDEFTIKEIDLGDNKYISLKDELKIYITKSIKDNAYVVSKVSFDKSKDVTSQNVTLVDNTQAVATVSTSENNIKITIPNKPAVFDMALRKSISEVKRNGEKVDIGESREPVINSSSAAEYARNKTAGYYHTKNPITVKPGDTVIYTLRVYNEGYIDGYAKQITDYLPKGLEYIEDSQINKDNGWNVTKNEDGTTTVTTDKLKDALIPAANGADGFAKYCLDKSSQNEPEFSKYVQIECKVKEDIQDSKLLVNVAEITNYGYNDEQGNYIEANKDEVDIDSKEDNVFNNKDNINNKIDEYYDEIVKPQYKEDNKHYKGKQDDDDFENIIVNPDAKEFKFVLNKVDEQGNPLIGADFTVERFKDNKNDVLLDNKEVKGTYEVLENDVKFNNTYTYKVVEVESAPEYVNVMEGKYITIQTYMNNDKKLVLGTYKNSDDVQITLEDGYYTKYGFTINNEDGSLVTDEQTDLYEKIKVAVINDTEPSKVTITIPNEKEIIPGKYNIQIKKVDANNPNKTLENAIFTVIDRDNTTKDVTTGTNGIGVVAQNVDIIKTEEGKTAIDNYVITEKSVPEGYVLIKDYGIAVKVTTGLTSDKANYELKDVDVNILPKNELQSSNEEKEMLEKGVSKTINGNTITITIPNKPEEKDFDLALRKFITGVNDKEVTSRIPVFKIDEKGNYVYNHDKEPVLVANSNIVTYTLRVYNEGEVAGYAREIKDDIPNGLEFLPDNDLNKEYRWLMLDKYGKETDDVSNAKYITTDYLSKEQETTEGSNLLKPFDEESYKTGTIKEPDYKEVKVAFKVNVPDKSEEIIINQAQISDDSDEDGNDVTDKDSTPDEWIDGEDDQDIEKIKVQYFDLALRKWVTKAIVTEKGTETIYETGHKAEDDPEAVVKVDLKKSNINDVTVKFEYKIRIENQGKIAGYAKEISDYIPEGLKFVKEDNPLWEEVDGKVVTDQLKDTLLEPGETAEVTILLTWINREDNMGLKVNVAEISKDYNEYGTPDIDSTPNNKVDGEDDIDDAPVMLTVKTGEEPVYIILTIAVLGILSTGIILIKKYVL